MTPRWACVLVVSTVAPLAACTDDVPAATTPTGPSSPATDVAAQPPPTLGRHGVAGLVGAEFAPDVATPDQEIVVTPAVAVEPTCGVSMAFYDPYLWGDRELIGLLLGTGEWAPFDPSVSTTVLACVPPPISAPVSARIPGGLDDGLYQACIGAVGTASGCNLLRVIRPGELATDAAGAAVDPLVVAPGEEFTVTRGEALVCSRFELLIGVDGALVLVGFPTQDGEVFFDVPGATTTAPRCGVNVGLPPDEITFVTPDVPDGSYLFCLASRFDPPGCARVTVER